MFKLSLHPTVTTFFALRRAKALSSWAIGLGLALVAANSGATSWQAGYHNSIWQASEPSQLNCELSHYIPEFGEARFIHQAGASLSFEIQPFRNALRGGQVQLVALAPQWQPGTSPRSLGVYDFNNTDLPLRLATPQAELILESLRQGLMPAMLQEDSDSRIERRRASLTPINFHQALASFQQCQARLLPINYEQIRDITINFALGGAQLSQADKDQLDLVVRYIYADPEVIRVRIDGHSDALGSRRDNRQLSSERAQAVTEYLLARGMPEALVQTNYHGQRYPLASNATAEGRGKNRRVTIQLDKELEIQPLF